MEKSLSDIDDVRKDVNGHTIMEQAIEIKAQGNENTASLLTLNDTNLISQTDKNKNPINLSATDISLSSEENEEIFTMAYTWETIINYLNQLREEYLLTKDNHVFESHFAF